ncbi:hypothetical protein CHARACLAT_015934 [Characodon lateralis]|uniref:Uncharacterized protein n=1 Tax=Characodon lateralis TaxID=208331 RepID=A0ABU7F3E7_9TELE|nr:hypothetical protein [Characodon lateralis]
MPRAGDDLEALPIHLCFCRANLHQQKTARSGSTLVSSVGNIYLSQQTGNKPGLCSQTEPTAGRVLNACCVLFCEEDLRRTGSVCLFASH